MRYHFTPTKRTIADTNIITSVGENVEKLEPLYTAGENVKWYVLENRLVVL